MKQYAPVVIRIGMSLVIIWFGVQQMIDAPSWLGFLPEWTASLPISQMTFVYMNGIFEIIFGVSMALGMYTRIVALLLALHLFGITFSLGYTALAVRDFGLSIATLTVFLFGPDHISLDKYFESK